ncbi:MAG: hypothetical protein IPI30_02540 [Saprospiraceae bacterium]|nr:hypothetical protein [Candidatus Vicinibacter affinis]
MEEINIKKEDLQDIEILKSRYPLANNFFIHLDQNNLEAADFNFQNTLYRNSLNWNKFSDQSKPDLQNASDSEEKKNVLTSVIVERTEEPEISESAETIQDFEVQTELKPEPVMETGLKIQSIPENSAQPIESRNDDQSGAHASEVEESKKTIITRSKKPKINKSLSQKQAPPSKKAGQIGNSDSGLSENSSEKSTDSFYSWLSLLEEMNPKRTKVQKQSNPTTKVRKTSKGLEKIQLLVEESQHLKEEVVSETLAQLLDKQGHKEEAIKMYEKLSIKFPDKSATFAILIKKLKS